MTQQKVTLSQLENFPFSKPLTSHPAQSFDLCLRFEPHKERQPEHFVLRLHEFRQVLIRSWHATHCSHPRSLLRSLIVESCMREVSAPNPTIMVISIRG